MDKTEKIIKNLFESIFDVIIGNLYEDAAKYFDDIYPGVSDILRKGENEEVLTLTCTKDEVYNIIVQSLDKSKSIVTWTLNDCDIDNEDNEMSYIKEWIEDFKRQLLNIYKDLTKEKEQISLFDISIYILTIESIKKEIIKQEIEKIK